MTTKQKLLKIFEENRGKSLSGAKLAEQLQVSRNAIWKNVNSLIAEGYTISAVTNKGYCFSATDNDKISVAGLTPFLIDSKLATKITVHDTIDSTNTAAKKQAIDENNFGKIIIANEQIAGRGRLGRSFHSPANSGIYLSIILAPDRLKFSSPTFITIYAALAVCLTIEKLTGKTPQLKWVNDVFLNGKKICGILTESMLDFENGTVQWFVLGIGINVELGNVPAELTDVIGAIFEAEKATITRNQIAAELINQLLSLNEHISEPELIAQYRERLYMLGMQVDVVMPTYTYTATAIDITDAGHLLVEKTDGEQFELAFGEISVRPKK
jgi:birA, biotin-[acetyl-CoA-carboxylase] ligase region